MSLKATLEETAAGWISDLESRSLDNVVSRWTDDIHYSLHPDVEGVFPMNREQFRTYERAASFFKLLKTFKITINEMFTDEGKRTVKMLCSSKGELEAGPYGTDYVFVLTMTEDGKRIKKLSEWPDFHKVQMVLSKTLE
ncbi:uncharacterized protein N7479_008278 [Penicillium vulpinum]|uniref:SnoaL-like domain-containing protein n=1 Tax=Penicillium vulpinum TaxID=29845 RepID=A0A1V6RJ33_9EURO|nr:uncharacterized protein N7479_008278 [Penicillium vulpinum]KAJ5961128.1 hypothetical protein N7479_008278 [Penicillium vulpinum]OQE01626.1 hypothetical protein PENVUL_c042G03583 [Penicillium vulpinum]